MIKSSNKKPELLSPAGSPQSLKAAIEGGADAIYLGMGAFNARMKAKNFTEDELSYGIELAHSYGARVYIAANTLLYDRELDEYLCNAEKAYLLGADAIIAADLGGAKEIRKRIPIELHASTQLSGHSVESAKRLCEAGFSRMVLAREMSREDIEYFCKDSPIEAEVFVHGALCVCHSGQCLFSSIVGGRSGNRGECAQPCRLPYKNGKRTQYPLSLKDLSLAGHVKTLCEMGVASFKIEGRMKSPEYVRDVTKVFRRLIDENRNADADELEYLARVFSRSGHTDAYFTSKKDSSMLGIRSESDKRESAESEPFEKITRRLPLTFKASLKQGRPASLTAIASGREISVEGATPETARTAPISEETLKKCLSKLGDTPYFLEKLEIELDEGLMLPISSLNALRRSAIEALGAKNTRSSEDFFKKAPRERLEKNREKINSAVFFQPQKMPKDAKNFFNYIYIPLEAYSERTCGGLGVMLPEVIFDSERAEVEGMLAEAYANGARDALVGNLGHIELAKRQGFTVHGDLRLGAANSQSVAMLTREGLNDIILSPELTLPQIRDIGGKVGVCVYGRLPLMITEKCVGLEIGGCRLCESGEAKLIDRRDTEFPVLKRFGHRSAVFNSVPIYMADRENELKSAGVSQKHFIFTTESENEIREIIKAYKTFAQAKTPCRRIKK